jgi:hypothetical protein
MREASARGSPEHPSEFRDPDCGMTLVEHGVAVRAYRAQVLDGVNPVTVANRSEFNQVMDLDAPGPEPAVHQLEVESADRAGSAIVSQALGPCPGVALVAVHGHALHAPLRVTGSKHFVGTGRRRQPERDEMAPAQVFHLRNQRVGEPYPGRLKPVPRKRSNPALQLLDRESVGDVNDRVPDDWCIVRLAVTAVPVGVLEYAAREVAGRDDASIHMLAEEKDAVT